VSTISPTEVDDPGTPLRALRAGGLTQLIEFFSKAEKPRDRFRVGTEHEKFGVCGPTDQDGKRTPLPFWGSPGIQELLLAIAADEGEARAHGPFVPAHDGGHTIALFRGDASITLEPGGQFELSGAPFFTVHETHAELDSHLALLARHARPRGIEFVGLGFHPTATWSELPLVPKNRYAVMTRYMPKVGRRGLDMMKRTATVQANYDWSSEKDMVASMQTALSVAPLVAALFANAPFFEGRPSGAVSERQRVWADTDPHRAGFPDVFLASDFSYERYVQWVLDVPMYFVRRDGLHHDVAGASFRAFVDDGLDIDGVRVRATMRDFADHLTTLFPEVRLKRVLEVRSADVGPPPHVCALPALYKGILYDDVARDRARALLEGASGAELSALRADVAERGFRAEFRGTAIVQRCRALVAESRAGLVRLGQKNARGDDESVYLAPLQDVVDDGRTFSERLVQRYETSWGRSLAPLWEECGFLAQHRQV
jgi:glutamate--cysteine ligase